MIRLPVTGIDISQHDLNFHLQQLDICQGLLKQGFKKHEIVGYFKSKQAQQYHQETINSPSLSPARSTCDLPTEISPLRSSAKPQTTPQPRSGAFACLEDTPKQSVFGVVGSTSQEHGATRPETIEPEPRSQDGLYAPRQSSLLRFVLASPLDASSDDHKITKIPFSPRANITYRPRYETYSYDQSELDDEDSNSTDHRGLLDDFEHLALDTELLPASASSTKTPIQPGSSLRPEADTFTPMYLRLVNPQNTLKGKQRVDVSSDTDGESLPSSPPVLSLDLSRQSTHQMPPLPTLPHTPAARESRDVETTRRQLHQQYFDGSFTVYDDAMPATLQPQTPADLRQGHHLNEFNAAYTAPPGMIRSPLRLPGSRAGRPRLASGELSPTARAVMIRERRQREFVRSARIEELRIGRTRAEGAVFQNQGDHNDRNNLTNFWRDDLDADAVGEENFDDGAATMETRRMRTISGNGRSI